MLNRRDASAIYHVALIGLAMLFVWLTIRIDALTFGGVLFATCLSHATGCLRRRTGWPRAVALLLLVLLILVSLAAIGWFFSNRLADQVSNLSQRLSTAVTTVAAGLNKTPIGHALHHMELGKSLSAGVNAFSQIFDAASNIVEIVIGAVVIAFIGVYGAAEADTYICGVLRLVPPTHRKRAAVILAEAGQALWDWAIGRLCAMVGLGGLTMVGLWALGVTAPIALGLLAGLLSFIPYAGAFLAAAPALLLAFAVDETLALYVLVLYLAIHAIEGYILIPLVQRRAAHLPPVLILVSQLIGGALVGFLGLLFATPALAAILVLIREIYVEDGLGDRT